MDRLRWSSAAPGERVLRVWLGRHLHLRGGPEAGRSGLPQARARPRTSASQLDGFAQGSPIAPLLDLVGHAPELTGVATAVTEILIGLATLAGVAPLIAASVGALLSISLWLSASWHVDPYFLGSDSIYAVAWIAYGLSLPTAAVLLRAARERTRPKLAVGDSFVADERRRSLIRGGAVVGLGAALARLRGGRRPVAFDRRRERGCDEEHAEPLELAHVLARADGDAVGDEHR